MEVAPGAARAADLARGAALVVPSPGVPVGHPALVAALALGDRDGERDRAGLAGTGRPRAGADAGAVARLPGLVAITGTNGKTTVTELVTAMLAASGLKAVAAGNVGYPLLDAVAALGSPAWQTGAPARKKGRGRARRGCAGGAVLVAEVSSFQLEYTRRFRPDVSCWLNFAPDHLDWHPNIEHYSRAKAKIWAHQAGGSTAVVNADDPVVRRSAGDGPGRGAGRDLRERSTGRGDVDGPAVAVRRVEGPDGMVVKAAELPRAFPHDLANVAAALAVAMAAGASWEGCRRAARRTAPPPHRVQLVAGAGGVRWYDDSKATTPAAVQAGVSAFSSVVLIAGGRNKGLDLSELAKTVPPVRAVVAIGEAAAEVAAAFGGLVPVRRAASMDASGGNRGRTGRAGGRRRPFARLRQLRLVLLLRRTGRTFRRPGGARLPAGRRRED